jgi:hypothetical protein
MDDVQITKNLFSSVEIDYIKNIINKELSSRVLKESPDGENDSNPASNFIKDKKEYLGRIDVHDLKLPETITNKVTKIFYDLYDAQDKSFNPITNITYVEYSAKNGIPRLPVHIDNGKSGIIIDYQLESNIEWPIGIEEGLYQLKDNEALIFYPLSQYHWRPNIKWNNDSFVKMIFFDFYTPNLEQVIDKEKQYKLQDFVNRLGESNDN